MILIKWLSYKIQIPLEKPRASSRILDQKANLVITSTAFILKIQVSMRIKMEGLYKLRISLQDTRKELLVHPLQFQDKIIKKKF